MSRHRGEVGRYFPYHSKRVHDAARRNAAAQVSVALREGRLTRRPCEVCGGTGEAHHEDYGRALEVKWLCRKHHSERHSEIRQAAGDIPISPVDRSFTRTNVPRLVSANNALVLAVTNAVADALDSEGVTLGEMAGRLGTSRESVGQHLSGGIRTLRILQRFMDVLGYEAHFSLVKRESKEVV